MDRSDPGFAGNIERFSGFADLYDRFRPQPPALLSSLLPQLAQVTHPQRVVDLGSGTGLSSRYWAAYARQVIGIEPTADMRRQAEAYQAAHPGFENVTYQEGYSHQTGLPAACAQIVTCAQALHWMEPQTTFEEARRILQPGGVFAAFDYDWPPTTGSWQADAAYEACMEQVRACERQTPQPAPVRRWEKEQHLARMQASGCFRYVKEVVLHHLDEGNAERLVGLLLSQGGVMSMLKAGYTEAQLGIVEFRQVAERTLGAEPYPWLWSSRLRYGIV